MLNRGSNAKYSEAADQHQQGVSVAGAVPNPTEEFDARAKADTRHADALHKGVGIDRTEYAC